MDSENGPICSKRGAEESSAKHGYNGDISNNLFDIKKDLMSLFMFVWHGCTLSFHQNHRKVRETNP